MPSFLIFTSCIQDEALNMEADITDFTIKDSLFISSVISEESKSIQIFINGEKTKFAPEIKLSKGASVFPKSGDSIDFSKPIQYKVTSEDGGYTKTYTIELANSITLVYEFENWAKAFFKKYPILESDNNIWSSGNSGVALVMTPTIWPTAPDSTNVYTGKYSLKLETIKGRKTIVGNIPIFAGSLFIGKFSPNMSSPAKSLHLGQAFVESNGKALTFSGYYKYIAGNEYTDKDGNIVKDKEDECSMYAVIFEVPKGDQTEYLDGESIFTSDKVVARAEWTKDKSDIYDHPGDKGFTAFEIPFIYNKELDYRNYDYKFTVVLSSSKDGNSYEGAVGSTLYVDQLEIVCEKKNTP